MKLYLASSNPGKLREFRDAGAAHGIAVEALPGIGSLPDCVEDGMTFEENAGNKAVHYSRFASALVCADDSGLCVDSLAGAPGVYSARFAGEGASAGENNAKLLSQLQHSVNRDAHFVCVMALAEGGRILTAVEGRADGLILEAPRGQGGFGYDPLFFFPPLGKTFAELKPEEKREVSHRGKAFRMLLEYFAAA